MDIIALDKEKTKIYMRQLAEQRYNTAVRNIKYIGGGSYGLVYRAEMDAEPRILVLKAYRVKDMNLKEKMQIELLSQHSGIRFPKIYFAHSASDAIPADALAMEYINGVNAMNPLFMLKSKAKRMRFGDIVAANSLKMHSRTNAKFGFLENPVYDTWDEFYFQLATDIIRKTKEFVEAGKLNKKHLITMQTAYDNYDKYFVKRSKNPRCCTRI